MNVPDSGPARILLFAAGKVGWVAFGGLLLRRSLHMLQLEGYLTVRFLRWWIGRPTRVTSPPQLVGSLAGLLAAWAAGRRGPLGLPAEVAWCGLGWALARSTRFPDAKKPLVMTARARRLAGGQAALGLGLGAIGWWGPRVGRFVGRMGPRSGATRRVAPSGAKPAAEVGRGASGAGLSNWARAAAVLPLVAPLVTAAANLMLYPVEEALRRYYLRDAARKLRRLGPTVVAVAGSYGKTSTKEFLATILAARYEVLKPPGSYNTPMGLSRVIRDQLRPDHEVFVAELGDWVPGDIAFLCRLLRPSVGVLTTIGPEHLERFKTMERVVASKLELIQALPPDGVAVINQDDPQVRSLSERAAVERVIRYGLAEPGAEVRARDVRTTRQGLRFVVEAPGHQAVEFQVGVLGRHNVANLLAATAAALALGMSLDEIARAARGIKPVEHRLQPIEGAAGLLVIDDAFNSNPRGAAAALEVLGELEARRRVLVTPGMVELGEREDDENRGFGRRAAEVCDAVVLVGRDRAAPLLAGLRDGGFDERRVHLVGDLKEASARLGTLVGSGDVVLFENDLPDTYADAPGRSAPAKRTNGAVRAAPAPLKQREYLEIDGLRLAYRATGPDDGSTPIVVLHGWGASIDAVGGIQDSLGGERRVVAFDLPGFGASDPPPAAWGSSEYAVLIRRALDRLGLRRVHLLGHSFGGKVALVLATRWPELVERIVLVDSAGIRPARSAVYRARVAAYRLARRLAGRSPLGAWLAQRFGSADYRAAGPLRPTLVKVVNEDLRPLLPRVAAPTLLIWGDRDQETPLADAAIMEREIPDAGLVVFPGAGHFAYADDLPRFVRVVGHFLQ